MVLTGVAALALAYLQTRGVFVPGFEYYPGAGPNLVTGPYFNPSHFSGFLIPVAALLTSLILLTRPHLHTLALAGLLAALHWLNLKTDASSIPAVFLATALPFLVWVWTKCRWVGATLTGLALGTAVFGGVFFLSPQGQALFAQHKSQIGLANSWQRFVVVRQAVWRYGEDMWQQHPLTGTGVGQFLVEAPRYRAVERVVGTGMDAKAVNYAHSDYLQLLAELGVIGLGLFSAVLLTPFLRPRNARSFLLWPSALIALAFASVYDGHLTVLPGTFLTAFGLLALAATTTTRKPRACSSLHRVPVHARPSARGNLTGAEEAILHVDER
nr:O-antigen ligase family protein [Deinococcus aestuarii]